MQICDPNRDGWTVTRDEGRAPLRLTRDGRCELATVAQGDGTQFGTRRAARVVRDINAEND